MDCITKLKLDIASEYETLVFLKEEVKAQAEAIKRLEAKVVMAYSYGFEDCYKGIKFDAHFKIDYIELGDIYG